MENYYWYERAKCIICNQYIWTTGYHQSIVCSCTASKIELGNLSGNASIVTNDNEFIDAVKVDTNNIEINVIKG